MATLPKIGCVGVVENIVHEDLAHDETRDNQGDVLPAHLDLRLEQALVLFDVGYFVRHLELVVQADHRGQLSLLKVDQELGWDRQLSKRYHRQKVMHLKRHTDGFLLE